MTAAAVIQNARDFVCETTLNRPDYRNAMSPEMLGPFQQIIDQVKADRDIRCVVITGSGSSFCSGADFRSGILDRGNELPYDASYGIYRPFLTSLDVQVPVIAAMKGHAIAAETAACAPAAVRMMRRSLYRGLNWDPKAAGEIAAFAQSRTLEMADAKEGVAALLEKRRPRFRGA
jgi:enoyl-CoA hydratase/carnithine racemase